MKNAKRISWLANGKALTATHGGLTFHASKYRGRFRGKAVYFWKLESDGKILGRYMHFSVLVKKIKAHVVGLAARNKRLEKWAKGIAKTDKARLARAVKVSARIQEKAAATKKQRMITPKAAKAELQW